MDDLEVNSWDDYQEKAMRTALQPILGKSWVYPFFGLVGESGEMAETVDLAIADKADRDEALAEIGDVYWYVAALSHELGLKLSDIASIHDCCLDFSPTHDRVDPRKEKGKGSCHEIMLPPLGELAELMKKSVRDDGGDPSDERMAKIQAALGQVLVVCEVMAGALISDPRYVMTKNVKKLHSRQQRGVIKGDGDNR